MTDIKEQKQTFRPKKRLEPYTFSMLYFRKGVEPMGRYVILRGKRGFRFNLLAINGQVVGSSEVYTTKISCFTGIESVRRIATAASLVELLPGVTPAVPCPRFELYMDRAGEFRFRLRARNGKIVLVSEGYARKDGCLKGIESVRRNADSRIEE